MRTADVDDDEDDVSAGTAASLIETALAGETSRVPEHALRDSTYITDPSTGNSIFMAGQLTSGIGA